MKNTFPFLFEGAKPEFKMTQEYPYQESTKFEKTNFEDDGNKVSFYLHKYYKFVGQNDD